MLAVATLVDKYYETNFKFFVGYFLREKKFVTIFLDLKNLND